MRLLEFFCQLILNLSVGFSFGLAFAKVLFARLERREKQANQRKR